MNKKKKLLRALEAVLFCAVLTAVTACVSHVMERKASMIRLRPFLERAEDYDVLFIGDSHVVNGVFPMEIWQDYGIAGYNLASYGNTLPMSYWVMRNALDYAKPELIVIGIKDVEKSYKLSGSAAMCTRLLTAFRSA